MLETPEAISNADAIAAVPGIDAVHIGSSDLSTEMGIPGDYRHERMRAAYAATAPPPAPTGRPWGSAASAATWNSWPGWSRSAVRYLSGASDIGYVLAGGKADVAAMRGLAPQ